MWLIAHLNSITIQYYTLNCNYSMKQSGCIAIVPILEICNDLQRVCSYMFRHLEFEEVKFKIKLPLKGNCTEFIQPLK